MTGGRKREEERGREEGEGKEAETCFPQWGKKRKREKGKGGREKGRKGGKEGGKESTRETGRGQSIS